MKTGLKFFLLLSILFATPSVNAEVMTGANITYEHLGGTHYKAIVNVFRNCDEINVQLPDTIRLNVYDNCDSPPPIFIQINIPAVKVSTTHVSQLCSNQFDISSCIIPVPGQPSGVELIVYEAIFDVGAIPGEYRVTWNGTGWRSPTQNVNNTFPQSIFASAAVIVGDAGENNSAIPNSLYAPYFCAGEDISFNFAFSDPDQDDLVYSFAPAQKGGAGASICGSSVNYAGPHTGSEPIPGITIDENTGQINFNSAIAGDYTIAIQVDEYRNGHIVGSTSVDVIFRIQECVEPPPVGLSTGIAPTSFTGTATLVNPSLITMCEGQEFEFEYSFSSLNPGATLEVASNINTILPSANVTFAGTNPVTATVQYTAQEDDLGGVLILDVSDDNCPVSGISSAAVMVRVHPNVSLGPDISICNAESIQLSATGGTEFTWTAVVGEPLVVGANISCQNCANPTVTPNGSSLYSATSNTSIPGCSNSDAVAVNVGLDVMIDAQPETCDTNDGYIDITVISGSGDYALQVNSFTVLNFTGIHTIQNLGSGETDISILDNVTLCSFDTTIVLDAFGYAGENFSVCGFDEGMTSAVLDSGEGEWTSFNTNVYFVDPTDPQTVVGSSWNSNGSQAIPIFWTVTEDGCSSVDTVVVTFFPMPDADAGLDSSLCGYNINLYADPSTGIGTWINPDVEFEDPNDENTMAEVDVFTTYEMIWEEDNNGCTDRDTVYITFTDAPIANAGLGDSICGMNDILLSSIPSGGTDTWSFPPEVYISDGSLVTDSDITINTTTLGNYPITLTATDGSCVTTDEITVYFSVEPNINAGSDDEECGNITNLGASTNLGNGYWTGANSSYFSDTTSATAEFNAPYGEYELIWNVENAGCSASDTTYIYLVEDVPSNAGISDSTCLNSYTLNADPVLSGVWIPNSLVTNGYLNAEDIGNPNATITFPAGDYTPISLIWGNLACSQFSEQIIITPLETPSPDIGTYPDNCGLEITMAANDPTWDYEWIVPEDFEVILNNVNPHNSIIKADTSGTHPIIWQENNGDCFSSDTVFVNFIGLPTPVAEDVAFECEGTTEITVNPDANGLNGFWTLPTNVTSTSNLSNTTINVSGPDSTYNIIWTEYESTLTCMGSDTATVLFTSAPDTLNFQINCENDNTQYQVTFDIVNGDQNSYAVTAFGNTETVTGNSYVSSLYNTADTFNFALTDQFDCMPLVVEEPFYCEALSMANTLVPDTIYACFDANVEAIIAEGGYVEVNDASLYVLHTSPTNDLNVGNMIDWNNTGQFYANDNLAGFTEGEIYYISHLVGDSAETVNDIDFDDPNLSISDPTPVIFSDPPAIDLDPLSEESVSACAVDSAFVNFELIGLPTWEIAYSFNNQILSVDNLTNSESSLIFGESGTLEFLSITSHFGNCYQELNEVVEVIVYDNPTMNVEPIYNYCSNEVQSIIVELEGNAPWYFEVVDEANPSFPIVMNNVAQSNSQIVIDVPEGLSNFTISNLMDAQCISLEGDYSTVVQVYETPESHAGEDVELCFGDSTVLGAENEPGLTYSWNNAAWLNNPSVQYPIAEVTLDTTVLMIHPFVLTTSNANCDVLDTVNVIVHPLPHNITVDQFEPQCSGQEIQLNVSGPYDFAWGPQELVSNPFINNPVAVLEEDAELFVYALSSFGCVDSTNVIIDILEAPEVLISANSLGGCLPVDVEIAVNTVIDPNSQCVWTITSTNEFISESCDDQILSLDEEGDYSISLRVIGENGCISEASLDTALNVSSITADIEFTPSIINVNFFSAQLIDLSEGAVSWDWSINDELFLDEQNPVIALEPLGVGDHNVCLQVMNAEGCISDTCKILTIDDEPLIWVPNAFTPNNDNLNDIFLPKVIASDVDYYRLSIYDRLGNKLFETEDVNGYWEGQGSQDVFVWEIELKLFGHQDPLFFDGIASSVK